MSSRDRLLKGVAVLLALLVVVASAGLAVAGAYPSAASRAGASLVSGRPALAAAINRGGTLSAKITERAREGYEYRLAGPARRVFSAARGRLASSASGTAFAATCTTCHQDFDERPVHGVVYFEHSRHEGVDGGCESCHTCSALGRCEPPSMDRCDECHPERTSGTANDCVSCHPPGSVFHGGAIAGDRDTGGTCEVCHRESRLVENARAHEMPSLDDSCETCEACHEPGFCSRCHPAEHAKGYPALHAADLRGGARSARSCWKCHYSRWCAMRCHARTKGQT